MTQFLLLIATVLGLNMALADKEKPIQEPPLKFENQQNKESSFAHTKTKDLKSKWKAPRKVFPKSNKAPKDPDAPKSLDEQIKDADRSDMEE